jgi:hypothetical protein
VTPGPRAVSQEGVKTGDIRDDVPPGELASYCLHALIAAGGLPSEAAVRRLLAVSWPGCALRPDHLDPAPGDRGTP